MFHFLCVYGKDEWGSEVVSGIMLFYQKQLLHFSESECKWDPLCSEESLKFVIVNNQKLLTSQRCKTILSPIVNSLISCSKVEMSIIDKHLNIEWNSTMHVTVWHCVRLAVTKMCLSHSFINILSSSQCSTYLVLM